MSDDRRAVGAGAVEAPVRDHDPAPSGKLDATTAPRARWVTDLAIALGLSAIVIAGVLFLDPLIAGAVLLVAAATWVFRGVIFRWTTALFLLAAIVLFIPIRRYALPIDIGFALEPYRVVIAVLLVAVAIGLYTKRLTWKPIVWGWPIAIFLWTMLASVMYNAVEATESGFVMGAFSNLFQLAFLLSVVVIVRQLIGSERQVMWLLIFLVAAGAVVGLFAFFERISGFNIFLQLQNFLPLELLRDDAESVRAGGNRSYASSQHPIALSVLFCMLVPIGLYLMRFGPWPHKPFNRKLAYTIAIGAMMLGLLSAVSRTGIVVLGAMFLYALVLRPKLAGILFLIGLPFVVLMGLVLPKLFESTVLSLLNTDALIASQFSSVGMAGQGRLADIEPAMQELVQQPWFGSGLGSRVVVGDEANAQILDNQWLGTAMETGVVGVIGLIALLVYPVIRMVHFSFTSTAPQSRVFLTFAIGASALGYAVAAYFYDAFSFMQTLLMLSILLGIAAWAMTDGRETWPRTKVGEAEASSLDRARAAA
ncbi:O-antigen ligase family protein [Microbacterium allomyrinae]|uniref:O-antigen ligase family protein n=1 Tax=Microbacterium allomyrinae TaxID=2830666 RepID=A0A9X1LXP1_9MICO|nr:O-antigen ligase family protein [Microbacterium allomyrinae]MCC2034029.1 O-antigen ligase family protein [Microbacterium allomyrinae]